MLREPVAAEFADHERIYVSHDAYQILKYHGSYQQDDRERRKEAKKAGLDKYYQFMLRLKVPGGEVPASLYRLMDDMATEMGQNDLRATTRQAWQMHGILKGNMKTVIARIMKAGSSTVGACGDVSRNVMTSPCPKVTPEYNYVRQYAAFMGELFKPTSQAFSEIWLDGEKLATQEYWKRHLPDGTDMDAIMRKDTDTGIILKDHEEPLYGTTYLPRKFKVAVTVEGDNSVDLYINDIGLIVLMEDDKKTLKGFNVVVGGGMGRTHGRETTFARAAHPLGFVTEEDLPELMKSILAAQRDNGNREIRANARMKYLCHELGEDGFRALVETYFGKEITPMAPMKPWKYSDWMGWHETGDGTWFLGINIEQGRIRDFDSPGAENGQSHPLAGQTEYTGNYKTGLRKLIDTFDLDMVLSPSQSVILTGIKPEDREAVNAMMRDHGMKQVEEIDPLTRLSIACPALPLCGLAVTEAERLMPQYIERTRALLEKVGMADEEILMRMTGCPNGCARPYMAELALVGDGPKMYQMWLGGSPVLDGRTAFVYKGRVKNDKYEEALEPVLLQWKKDRLPQEALGDYCWRVGVDALPK